MQRIVKARSYVAIIDKARRLPPPEPAPKVRVSAEERAKIMAEVWGREDSDPAYSPKTFPKVGANTENPDV